MYVCVFFIHHSIYHKKTQHSWKALIVSFSFLHHFISPPFIFFFLCRFWCTRPNLDSLLIFVFSLNGYHLSRQTQTSTKGLKPEIHNLISIWLTTGPWWLLPTTSGSIVTKLHCRFMKYFGCHLQCSKLKHYAEACQYEIKTVSSAVWHFSPFLSGYEHRHWVHLLLSAAVRSSLPRTVAALPELGCSHPLQR